MPATPPPQGPRSLASDAGREKLLVLLREHFARGQLDLGEMSRRVGVVLAATYSDEAAAAVTDLPLLAGPAPGESPSPPRARLGQRRRHAQRAQPAAGWVPTPERFRDPFDAGDRAGLDRPRRPEPPLRPRGRRLTGGYG